MSDNIAFIKSPIIFIAICEFFYCIIKSFRFSITMPANPKKIVFSKIRATFIFYLKHDSFAQ